MEIYINDKLVKAQILPVNKPTLDETLETFSFALISNSDSMPYAPCQSVKVITDSNETINLFLVTDSVEIFSLSPARYKHSITCVQNTRKLSKHLVRNSVFSQPAYLEKKSHNAVTVALSNRIGGVDEETYGDYQYHRYTSPNVYTENLSLSNVLGIKEKIKKAYFEVRMNAVLTNKGDVGSELPGSPKPGQSYNSIWREYKNITEITTATSGSTTWHFSSGLHLYYTDENGNPNQHETINPATFGSGNIWYPLNQKFRFERVEELAKRGCNDFRILVDTDITNFLSGECFPYKADFISILTFEFIITAETYVYTVYDILDVLRERQVKQRKINGVTRHDDYASLYMLPGFAVETELETLMKNTPAPNFIFTQSTLYECLADVFRLFDGIFTLNQYNELGIDYFNDRSGTKYTINTLKKTGQNASSSEDKYTNGLVANYQDGRTIENFPSTKYTLNNDSSLYGRVRTKNLGIPNDNNDFIFLTPHNIHHILECYFRTQNVSGQIIGINTNFQLANSQTYLSLGTSDTNLVAGFPILDITHWVVEQDIWTNLDSTNEEATVWANPSLLQQNNTIFFARNSNELNISYTYKRRWWETTQFALNLLVQCALFKMFGQINGNADKTNWSVTFLPMSNPDWSDLLFRIKYQTSVDGKLKIESLERKYDGETLIDQYNGGVDLNKMGLNILGLSLKLGQPTLNVTQKITTWNKRIKPGDIYNYQGKNWIANVCNYTILGNGKIQGSIQFVKDFNALAIRTQLLREKRMFNISSQLITKSEENIVEFIYFSVNGETPYSNEKTDIALSNDNLAYALSKSLGVVIEGNEKTFDVASVKPNSLEDYVGNNSIYIPLIKYGAGNSICFEMSFDEPMNAGNQTRNYENEQVWFNGSTIKYFTKAIKYTKDDGTELSYTVEIRNYENIRINDEFPVITTLSTPLIKIENFLAYKQANEIFALNYELSFLPLDSTKDFIGSEFINNNFFINSIIRNANSLRLYYGNKEYSVLETKALTNTYETINLVQQSLVGTLNSIRITFTIANSVNADYFALCDNEGNILFASNRGINGSTLTIDFTTSWKRVDNKVLEDY